MAIKKLNNYILFYLLNGSPFLPYDIHNNSITQNKKIKEQSKNNYNYNRNSNNLNNNVINVSDA